MYPSGFNPSNTQTQTFQPIKALSTAVIVYCDYHLTKLRLHSPLLIGQKTTHPQPHKGCYKPPWFSVRFLALQLTVLDFGDTTCKH